jgi:hypothetical protein
VFPVSASLQEFCDALISFIIMLDILRKRALLEHFLFICFPNVFLKTLGCK